MNQHLFFGEGQQQPTGITGDFILLSYASTPSEFFYSNDGGANFLSYSTGRSDHLRGYWIAPNKSVAVATQYRNSNGCVFTTHDGENWTQHSNITSAAPVDCNGSSDGEVIVMGGQYETQDAIASIDGGSSFYQLTNLNTVRGCKVSDDKNYIYFCGSANYNFYYRHSPLDGSGNETFNNISISVQCYSININSTGQYVILNNRTNGDLIISSDYGQSFQNVYSTGESRIKLHYSVKRRTISTDGYYCLFRTYNGSITNKLWLSTNTFQSFSTIYQSSTSNHIGFDHFNFATILVSDGGYIKKSIDYGSSWSTLLFVSGANFNTVNISDDENFITALDYNNSVVYFSSDGGANFSSWTIPNSNTWYSVINR